MAGRILIRLLLLAALLAGLHYGGGWLLGTFRNAMGAYHGQWGRAALAIALLLFILLLSLPFVPGMEIGLSLMMLFGAEGAMYVYLATLVALSLSFWVGRRLPLSTLGWLLEWLHLKKARTFALELGALSAEERLGYLVEKAPARMVPFLLRHRYVAVALALNLPGNWIIGGGGGIGLLAGMSGIFSYPAYLLAAMVAVSPLPILFLLGYSFLPW